MKNLKHPALMSLTVVIGIGFTAILIVLFVLTAGVDLLQQGLHDTEYNETFAGTDSCMEQALVEMNEDKNYTGETVTLGNVYCVIVASRVGNDVNITVDASQGNYVGRLEMDLDVSGRSMIVVNWEETL